MYLLPIQLLMRALGDSPISWEQGNISVPAPLLRFLLQAVACQSEFDEEAYLLDNPDVAASIRRGEHTSGVDHFASYGYFEGRSGGGPAFSENWYLRNNPDVAEAVRGGVWTSGRHHYMAVGIYEWRSPNPDAEPQLEAWRRALGLVPA